jgi:hypothetical protein
MSNNIVRTVSEENGHTAVKWVHPFGYPYTSSSVYAHIFCKDGQTTTTVEWVSDDTVCTFELAYPKKHVCAAVLRADVAACCYPDTFAGALVFQLTDA